MAMAFAWPEGPRGPVVGKAGEEPVDTVKYMCKVVGRYLFVPVANVIIDDVHHDRAFWGIRFPAGAFSFDEAAVDVVEDELEEGPPEGGPD